MASPGNQHCANCIGTLPFPIRVLKCWRLLTTARNLVYHMETTATEVVLGRGSCYCREGAMRPGLERGNRFFIPIPSHFNDFIPIPIPFPFPSET